MPHPRGRTTALLLSVALAAGALAAAAPVSAYGGDGLRREANEYRVEKGLDPVVGTALLDDISTHRAAQMVAANKLEHDVGYVMDRLNASGVCWQGVGEILAYNGSSDYSYAVTIEQWKGSEGHNRILLTAEYNAAGGAWKTHTNGRHYSVMVFAVLCGDVVASSSVPRLKAERQYDPDRQMLLLAGTVTGYKLSASGDVLRRKTVRFGSTHRTFAAARTRSDGKAWLKVSSGPFAGWWVRETTRSYVRGASIRRGYEPERRLVVMTGRYTAYKFSWLGSTLGHRELRTGSRTRMRADAWAMINGRAYYRVSSGPLDGFWLRNTDKVTLK